MAALAAALGCGGNGGGENNTTADMAELGRQIFFDTALSNPPGQSCATCHNPSRSFTDPISAQSATSQGAVAGRFGVRNSPSLSYAAFSPVFQFSEEEQDFIGGQFFDGRAPTLEEQAKHPLLGPGEMNNESATAVIVKVRQASYSGLFKQLFGEQSLENAEVAFAHLAEAVAAFERGPAFSSFSSKFDAFLAGRATLDEGETRGLRLFVDPSKGNCAACHPTTSPGNNLPPLLTDFTYDNLGAPKNPENRFYTTDPVLNPAGAAFVDVGLAATSGRPEDRGRFKVSSLRNVAVTAPYFHNGVFKTLKEVVHFYNRRDSDGVVPEVPEGVNHEELGNLGLTDAEEDDIVAFMQTFTDGYAE